MSAAVANNGQRPEVLRRKTLANNARLLILLGAVAMPFAIYGLVTTSVLPFVVAALAMVAGMATLALHQRQMFDEAVAGQVCALLAMGLLLTMADPSLADAGLGIAVLAPILGLLLGRGNLGRPSWIAFTVIVALGVVGAVAGLPPAVADGLVLSVSGFAAFAGAALLVGHTANRMSTAHTAYDNAQATAYRHLVEHVQDGFIRFSPEGDILMASRSSEQLFGCRRYELSSNGIGDRIHVLDRPAYMKGFSAANVEARSRVLEVRMRQDQPSAGLNVPHFIWVEVSLSPVMEVSSAAGRHEVVGLFRDITDRKDQERAMADAREAAEKASATKSRFLGTIGHELRTPLNAVVGFSEMMVSGIGGELSTTHREYAQLIHQSGKHLVEVVGMLLDMSRIEAGRFELQTEAFAVDKLVEPCFHMVESIARQRDVSLTVDIAKDLPLLHADERACRQVLINLLSNAIKFSHVGGTVRVSLKRQGQNLNLSVTDSGIGMAPESLDRIGEPFFQVQDGLHRSYEGTGLGLSIVKGLVDLHQGTLRAMSELGAGTTVTVLLPINGPAIKNEETGSVTPFRKEPTPAQIDSWPEEKRKAQ